MITSENNKELKFMNRGHMRRVAPSIFTEEPSAEVSKHYTHIPTTKVINDMESLGWGVIDCKEVKARTKATKNFQKHLVIFRNPDIVINGENNDTVYPQILLTNSHDGKNAFQFTAGLFRMICSNGLVISTTTFESVKMRHMGYTFEELQENIRGMVEQLPLTVESMNKMKETEMSQEKAVDFAKKALQTRFTENEMKRIKIDVMQLLQPVRDEDKGTDLWSIFNVVQEKVIEGDFEYRAAGKARKTRKIKNFKQDIKINSKMFDLALNYVS